MQLGPGIRRLFRLPASARRIEGDVDAELAFHLGARVEELVAQGVPHGAAREQALREFGDVRAAREELSAIDRGRLGRARRTEWWDAVRQDVRFAARSLRRQPSFLAVALLTLALGIGANSAIFSVVNAVLLRPLPYLEPDRLVSIWPEGAVPSGGFVILRDQTRSLASVAGYGTSREVVLTRVGEPVRVAASRVAGELFDVLGVGPMLGRVFERADNDPGRDRIVLLGASLWHERFGADPRVIGRTVTIDGIDRTIVGVMPPGFRFPSADVQLWIPTAFDPGNVGEFWGYSPSALVGRLRPGVTPSAARAEVAPIFDRIRAAYPWRMPDAWGADVDVVPLQRDVVGGVGPTLYVLLGAVVLVLLVACVNVANLCLARAVTREREMAIRAALGAGRWRVVRQLLTESLLIGLAGGVAGLAIAGVIVRALVPLLPAGTPRAHEIGIDATVLGFTFVLATVTGIIFGVAPALRGSLPDLRGALASGGSGSGSSTASRRLSETLVVAQLALAVVLLAGAGLLIRSFLLLNQAELGFRTENVLAAEVPMPSFPADTAARSRDFYDAVLARARVLPGVRAAAATSQIPFGDRTAFAAMDVEGHPVSPGAIPPTPNVVSVTPDYLRTMGIPLLAGRNLAEADREGAPLVALVDETAARQLWPGEDPLGKRIKYVWQKHWITVVGVVGSVRRDSLNSAAEPSVYRPMRQGLPASMRLVVRADASAESLAPAIRSAVAAVDASVPVSDVRLLRAIVADSAARHRFTMLLLGGFAAVALLLGAVGIYGVIAYAVSRRSREIGVRMALGADRGDVVRMVLRDGARVALLGIVLGVVGALAAGRSLAGFLHGITSSDPIVFATVPVLLAGVALAATLLPARRAARVDPLVAMRAE